MIASTSHSWLPTVTSPAPAVRTADHVLLRRATLARCREVTANCRSTQTGRLLGTGPAERLASQQRDHPSWQRARDIDRRVSCIASGLSQIRSSVKSDPAGLRSYRPAPQSERMRDEHRLPCAAVCPHQAGRRAQLLGIPRGTDRVSSSSRGYRIER